jgi:hypothetical protein
VRERVWELRALAVERDARFKSTLKHVSDRVIIADASSTRVQNEIERLAPFDYVIGNPPYAVSEGYCRKPEIVHAWGLHDAKRGVRLDASFVAQSLHALHRSGSAAFILPMAFFTDDCFQAFRKHLVDRFGRIRVLQLPAKLFGQAEVSTALCSLQSARSRGSRIEVGVADEHGAILEMFAITPSEAITRMDHAFHKDIARLQEWVGTGAHTLGSLGVEIVRGSATAKDMQRQGHEFLHTTDLPATGVGRFRYGRDALEGYQLAKTGDIVVPRVGSRCLMRQAVILGGKVAYTEGLYRLRAAPAMREKVLACLAGPIGETWRRLYAKGSCAKHITVVDLLKMPVLA